MFAESGEESMGVCDRLESAIHGGAVAQLGARLDGIEEVVGSNPIGSTNLWWSGPSNYLRQIPRGIKGHYATFGVHHAHHFPCASRLLASMALP